VKESAGILLYRRGPNGLEVLLVHPSGAYNRKAPWGIPKGLIEPDEPREETARREAFEETGVKAGNLRYLGSIVYKKSRKRVHCYIGEALPETVASCASWEIDGAEFLDMETAAKRIHPDQAEFLTDLVALLSEPPS
jgi:predicted NUDIX family NTP pyrophosphohydrolase